jgi:hypothetical protein
MGENSLLKNERIVLAQRVGYGIEQVSHGPFCVSSSSGSRFGTGSNIEFPSGLAAVHTHINVSYRP